MTTRFLLTCISSFFFDGPHTLDDLHEVIAKDARDLYHQGLAVPGMNRGKLLNRVTLQTWPAD